MYTIYHNPRCSKSRAALEILQNKGVDFKVVEYLKTGLDEQTLKDLAEKLALSPKEFSRNNEDAYKAIKPQSDADHFAAMVKEPILLQRPIVASNDKAIVARPPELLNDFLV